MLEDFYSYIVDTCFGVCFGLALCYQHLVGVAKLQISEIHTGPFTAKAVSAFMGTDLV